MGIDWPPYERALVLLGEFESTSRAAAKAAGTLDEKLRFHRLHRAIVEARRALRLNIHVYEDAVKVAAEVEERRCQECGEVQP